MPLAQDLHDWGSPKKALEKDEPHLSFRLYLAQQLHTQNDAATLLMRPSYGKSTALWIRGKG